MSKLTRNFDLPAWYMTVPGCALLLSVVAMMVPVGLEAWGAMSYFDAARMTQRIAITFAMPAFILFGVGFVFEMARKRRPR